jgi:hypothetical protein
MSLLDEILPLGPAPVRPEGWPPELREHLSASSLRMLGTCAEQFRRVYLKGERQRPGAALVWGSADHYAHEQNFSQKIDSHRDLPEDEVKLAFAEGFDRSIDSNGGEEEVDWGDDKPGDLKDRGIKLAAAYHNLVSPRVQPTSAEQPFSLSLPGIPVPLIGRLDLTTEATVIEGKTASAKKSKPEPQWRLQGNLYQLETGLPIEWHVKTKTKIPGVYTPLEEPGLRLVSSRTLLETTVLRVRRMLAGMLALYAVYGPDEPWPTGAPDYGWACDYCGFRPSCAWWQGSEPAVEVRPEPEPEHVKLERLVLAYAREQGVEEAARRQIDYSYAMNDPDEHIVWLKDQVAKAEA